MSSYLVLGAEEEHLRPTPGALSGNDRGVQGVQQVGSKEDPQRWGSMHATRALSSLGFQALFGRRWWDEG